MLKRTKGRILLTLLVVTGFAGTINNSAPTKKERKFAVDLLKDSRAELLGKIKGLSENQLNYRQSTGAWNIRECFFHLALVEKGLWQKLETAMNQHPGSTNKTVLSFSDQQIVDQVSNGTIPVGLLESFQPKKTSWSTMSKAQAAFRFSRTQYLKYIRTTTEDLRNHLVKLPVGTLDCYQLILLVSAYNERLNRQIDEIIGAPGFPAR